MAVSRESSCRKPRFPIRWNSPTTKYPPRSPQRDLFVFGFCCPCRVCGTQTMGTIGSGADMPGHADRSRGPGPLHRRQLLPRLQRHRRQAALPPRRLGRLPHRRQRLLLSPPAAARPAGGPASAAIAAAAAHEAAVTCRPSAGPRPAPQWSICTPPPPTRRSSPRTAQWARGDISKRSMRAVQSFTAAAKVPSLSGQAVVGRPRPPRRALALRGEAQADSQHRAVAE